MRGCIAITLFLLASACVDVPQLDSKISKDAASKPYPQLIPVENIRMSVPDPRASAETKTDLESRVRALRARAEALRGPVIDAATKQRMLAGIKR